jgi:GntR family transcriptional regulator/MocR family aminotransferase
VADEGGSGLDLHLDLAKDSGGVGRALESALREAIRSGRLAAGVRLPGSRSLAADLGLSRGTVVQVYAQLTAEGWLVGLVGSGTRVAVLPGPPDAAPSRERDHAGPDPRDRRTDAGPGAAGPGESAPEARPARRTREPAPGAPAPGAGTGPAGSAGSARSRGAAPGAPPAARGAAPASRPAGRASPGPEHRAAAPGSPVPVSPPGSPGPVDLRPGRPDLSSFPRTAWASSVRRAVAAADATAFDYGRPGGLEELRAVVAAYVSRTRGVRATAEAVVVTAGFSSGLALLARTFHRLGTRRAAIEDPCLERHRALVRAAGLQVDPLRVDSDGADPAALGDAGMVLLTPAHQHPRGMVLAPRRRMVFVEWARRNDGYLVEDDYDGEFRYDRQPVGAIQALAPDRVIFGGTTGKALAPGMRLGWLVVPPALRGPLLETIEDAAAAVPVIDQLALADLIGRGDYDRHIRRLRLVYRRRRTELAERLATVTTTPLEGVSAGLHALLPAGSADQERRLVAAGERSGLLLHGLHSSGYWHAPQGHPAALILGYATPPPHAWRRSLDLLTELVAADAGP